MVYSEVAMAKERRSGNRLAVQLWVEEQHDHGTYFQRAANLSAGGIFLEHTIPHPVGTRVRLAFKLPGDEQPIRVVGEIVNAVEAEPPGMGLKFVDLPADVRRRLDGFISSKK
jgi:uncharacterized protein (TIGR02266 family)